MHPVLALALALQTAAVPMPGTLTERVECRARPGQSYALYVPSHYSPARRWPVLFCFDPGARGMVPVDRFKDAAERYGWIVAGSNNSRNGPYEPNAAAAAAMMEDVEARFAIDPARVYTAGFSGGARVANTVAIVTNAVEGVFATGGGFPGKVERVPYVFFGAAGTEDFNWVELQQIDAMLEKLGTPHRLAIFEGPHTWAPADVCADALEWFELQAMKRGKRLRDEGFLESAFLQRTSGTREAGPAREWDALRTAARDFAGLRDVAGVERRVQELAGSREVRTYLREQKREMDRDGAMEHELLAALQFPADPSEQNDARARASQTIRRYQAVAAEPNDSIDRRCARRALGGAFVSLLEQARAELLQRRPERAVYAYTYATVLQPERAAVWIDLARAYSLAGNGKKSVEALREAVNRGFREVKRLETEPDFAAARERPEFAQLSSQTK